MPMPVPPAWMMVPEKASTITFSRSTCAASPPIIVTSFFAAAPIGPPETPASSRWMPFALAVSARVFTVAGFTVLWTAMIVSGRIVCSSPSGPATTAVTSASCRTQMPTCSTSRPSSAGVAAIFALPAKASVAAGDTSNTVSSTFPASCSAIGLPILPTPINPTFIVVPPIEAASAARLLFLSLAQHLLGHGAHPAAARIADIIGQDHRQLMNLFRRQLAFMERGANLDLKSIGLGLGGDHAHDEQAAIADRHGRARPDLGEKLVDRVEQEVVVQLLRWKRDDPAIDLVEHRHAALAALIIGHVFPLGPTL